MEGPKGYISRRLLELVKLSVPLADARLATLGGRGIEARLWSEMGIPPEHGWLIDRNRELSLNLIAKYGYRVCNRLSAFRDILAGHGDTMRIDGFHLDLCGTMSDEVIADFSPTLDVVLKSRGKCLAITVADQRGNMILEMWPQFEQRGRAMFGKQASALLGELLTQQKLLPVNPDRPAFFAPFDPLKGAKREFGLMTILAEMLAKYSTWMPSLIERYIYVGGGYEPGPFRMRTFLFQFEEGKYSPATLSQRWLHSRLFFSRGDAFAEIKTRWAPTPPKTEPEPEKGQDMPSRLAEIAKALGSAEEAEYNKLLEAEERLPALEARAVEAERNLRDMSQLMQNVLNSVPEKYRGTNPPRETSTAPKTSSQTVGGAPRRNKNGWKQLSDREQIEWLFKVMEMKARNGGALERDAWIALLTEDFGSYSETLAHSLRAALAHTNGRFRESFVRRIKATCGEKAQTYLDRLEKL